MKTNSKKSSTECRAELFEIRKKRTAPGRDDKVLVSWNGLMITAMAMAAQALGEERYAKAAKDAAEFVLNTMRDAGGNLLHSYKDGAARFNAYLDDYACFLEGLSKLYQATFEARYLEAALELAGDMVSRFADSQGAGFFYTASDHEELIVRQKDSQDNATPSGNGMAATALLELARLTGRSDLEDLVVQTLEMLSQQIHAAPSASGQSLIALDFLIGKTLEIVIAQGEEGYSSAEMLVEVHQRFLPNKVVLRRPKEVADDELPPAVKPLLSGKIAIDGKAAVYLCEHGVCQAPVTSVEAFQKALDEL
jgi:uncharacterized protein